MIRIFGFLIFVFSIVASIISGATALPTVPVGTGTSLSPSGIPGFLRYENTVSVPTGTSLNRANILKLVGLQSKLLVQTLSEPQSSSDFGFIGLGELSGLQILSQATDGTTFTYRAQNKIIIQNKILKPGETKEIKLVSSDQSHFEKAKIGGLNMPPATARPDYQALAKQVQIRGELHVSLLLGFDVKSTDPKDLGRLSYEYFLKNFAQDGFQSNGVDLIRPASFQSPKVRVSMGSARRVRDAFETSDVVAYAGAPGLTGNLDLSKVAIQFPHAYQIYYLDSSFSYYFSSPSSFVGPHHLDLVTNGTTADIKSQNQEIWTFLTSIMDQRHSTQMMTWLDILKSIESAAGKDVTYLVNVTPIR